VQVAPITASIEFLSGFQLELGGRTLMLPGDYPVMIRNAGYHDEQLTLTVGDEQAQNFPVQMRELPGIVSVSAHFPLRVPPAAAMWYLAEQLATSHAAHALVCAAS
jgi:hypothetical protein